MDPIAPRSSYQTHTTVGGEAPGDAWNAVEVRSEPVSRRQEDSSALYGNYATYDTGLISIASDI